VFLFILWRHTEGLFIGTDDEQSIEDNKLTSSTMRAEVSMVRLCLADFGRRRDDFGVVVALLLGVVNINGVGTAPLVSPGDGLVNDTLLLLLIGPVVDADSFFFHHHPLMLDKMPSALLVPPLRFAATCLVSLVTGAVVVVAVIAVVVVATIGFFAFSLLCDRDEAIRDGPKSPRRTLVRRRRILPLFRLLSLADSSRSSLLSIRRPRDD
jgi:hypothetical protein